MWLLNLVGDATICDQIMWYPIQKRLYDGFRIVRIYDELNTGDTWWKVQVCRHLITELFNSEGVIGFPA